MNRWEHRRRPWMRVTDNRDDWKSDVAWSVAAAIVFIGAYIASGAVK